MKRALGLVAMVVAFGTSTATPAEAFDGIAAGTRIYPARYLVCREERDSAPAPPRAVAPPPKREDPFGLVPVQRVRDVPRLHVVPHATDDVAFTEPLPVGVARPQPLLLAQPEPEVVRPFRVSRNDYRCLGYVRGKAGIVRVVDAPPGTRFRGHDVGTASWVQDNMIAAAAFDVREAIPALRKALARPHPKRVESGEDFDKIRTVATAAVALSELGDRSSSAAIHALLEELEGTNFGGAWRDTFRALARGDRAEASRYALEVVEKVASGRLPLSNTHEWFEVLPYLDPADRARALPALVTLTTQTELAKLHDRVAHDACRAFGARLRMGDAKLAAEVRKPLETTLDTNLATVCYGPLVSALYPGEDAREIPTLLFRKRHAAILALTKRLLGEGSKKAVATRAKLLGELVKMQGDPRLTGSLAQTSWVESDRAMWLAARAGLGDRSALAEMYAWIDDPRTDLDGPWIAAWAALDLGLPEAAVHAEKRLRIGVTQSVASVHVTDLDHGGTPVTARVRVLDALFAQESPAFALGLLQRDAHARERALFLLSRRRDADVCKVVSSALAEAERETVDEALWSLSTVGARCAGEMERVARDPSAPVDVRGFAMEHLAMVRSPIAASLAEAWDPGRAAYPAQASRSRVRIIVRSPE